MFYFRKLFRKLLFEATNSELHELHELAEVFDMATTPVAHEILVHRSSILKSMISEFSSPDILQYPVKFVFMGDNGEPEMGRGSGITREVLSLFWKEFSVALATGAS